jgi:hypothetical protein
MRRTMAPTSRDRLRKRVLLIIGLVVMAASLPAQERGRVYVGLSFAYSGLQGSEFDGRNTNVILNLVSGEFDVYGSIPKINPGLGALATIGIGGESLSLEFGVQMSAQTGTALGNISYENATDVAVKSTSQSIFLGARYRLGRTWKIRPYIFGGFSFTFLNVQKSLYHAVLTDDIYKWQQIGDVGYVGLGFQGGVGCDVSLGQHLVLTAGILARTSFYSEMALYPSDSSFNTNYYDTKIASIFGANLGAMVGLQFWFGNR